MSVYIVRHCESVFNAASAVERAANTTLDSKLRDADLSAKGESQLEQLRADAKALGPTAVVYCSPLRRAIRTAQAIAETAGGKVTVLPCARETRRDIGDVGSPPAALRLAFPAVAGLDDLAPEWWREACACPLTRECDVCAVARRDKALTLLADAPKQKSNIVLVSHSDFLHTLLDEPPSTPDMRYGEIRAHTFAIKDSSHLRPSPAPSGQ